MNRTSYTWGIVLSQYFPELIEKDNSCETFTRGGGNQRFPINILKINRGIVVFDDDIPILSG